MPLVQFDIPKELDKKLRLEMVKRDKVTKTETIIEILNEVLK